MDWYYAKNETQLGPISKEELQAKVSSGEIARSDMAWHDGMADWQPVSTIVELKAVDEPSTAPPLPGVVTGAPPIPMIQSTRTSGLAIASLVCGIVGLLGFFMCLFPALAGIGGIICGHMALGEIKKSSEKVEGRGMAVAGLAMGYISMVILVLVLVFFIGMAFFAKSAPTRGYESPPPIILEQSEPSVESPNLVF